jgi:hypothetical protein
LVEGMTKEESYKGIPWLKRKSGMKMKENEGISLT